MNPPEIAEKAGRLARLARERGLAGVLLGAQENLAWASAGRLAPIDTTREGGVATLLVPAGGGLFVLADAIEMPRLLAEELAGLAVEPLELPWAAAMAGPEPLLRRAREVCGPGPLASDRPLGGAVEALGREIARLRAPLTAAEVERFRALGRDAGEALGELCRGLSPGESEREVAHRTAALLAERGMEAVVLLVGADERIARFRHPLPTGLCWREALMVVACARRAGLTVALTRLVSAGAVPPETARRTEAVSQVFALLLAATRPGTAGAELYAVAAEAYRDAGFPGEERLHHQGGACGYLSRDWIAHPSCEERVEAPQGFAWNPSVTGTKVEETALAWPEGAEIVSATPGWPTLETAAGVAVVRAPQVACLADLRG